MHTIAPYSIRCFSPTIESKNNEDKYCVLNKIGSHDLFKMLEEFINSNNKNYQIREESKQVFKFSNVTFKNESRSIWGWFEVGSYGIKSDIINIDNGNVDFQKAKNNAEILKHYFHIFMPQGFNEAICIMHSYNGNGVKTLFNELFSSYFRSVTKLNLQMTPLAYEKAISAWQESNAKELRVTKFVGLTDIADQIKKLGHDEQELVMKPPRRGTLGKLKDYFNKDSEQARIVEILSPFGEQVKTVVNLNGKTRTFKVGANATNSICQIDLDESVTLDNGIPVLESFNNWVNIVIMEYSISMYPGIEVKL